MNCSENAPTSSSLAVDFSRALVRGFGRKHFSEAYDSGLFASIHRNVRDGAKFGELAVDVLSYFLADGDLGSGVLRCLYGQVLDVDREAPVLNLGGAELGHLDMSRSASRTSGRVGVLLLDLGMSQELWGRSVLLAEAGLVCALVEPHWGQSLSLWALRL